MKQAQRTYDDLETYASEDERQGAFLPSMTCFQLAILPNDREVMQEDECANDDGAHGH
jgi:hypothetical protein